MSKTNVLEMDPCAAKKKVQLHSPQKYAKNCEVHTVYCWYLGEKGGHVQKNAQESGEKALVKRNLEKLGIVS